MTKPGLKDTTTSIATCCFTCRHWGGNWPGRNGRRPKVYKRLAVGRWRCHAAPGRLPFPVCVCALHNPMEQDELEATL
jgi:hypothetical protein